LISRGESIPTTKIIGISLFNTSPNIVSLVIEENHEFIPSHVVESNILDHEDDHPPPNMDPFSPNFGPGHHGPHKEGSDEDKDEQVTEGKSHKKDARKPSKDKREEMVANNI